MDLEMIKSDVVKVSHILHQQGIAAAFGHVSARIGYTPGFTKPDRMFRRFAMSIRRAAWF
jgi:hypothetical protein